MNALEYARRYVSLWQSSPISGRFDEMKYPFVIDPLLNLDDIDCKTTVVYGPTQSFKTVYLQIATAYRLDIKRKSILAIAQTDDDSREFATIKLNPFLERIPSLKDTVRQGRYSITLSQWLWVSHELIISGPGENAQQSKSVCYLHTDEAHRYCVEYPGAMAALDNRMGLRWDRHALHVTTAADSGTEVDVLYFRGQQNEWHLRCVHCNQLFQPLWKESSRETYNGHEIFVWTDSQSETETLDSVHIRCPHCDHRIDDAPRVRADMDDGARYVAGNPDADRQFNSFRWNAFAPRWKAWRDLLAIYLHAIHAARLGDIAPYKDWVTKQEVRTNMGDFPMLGDSVQGRDYDLSDVEVIDEGKLRTCSFDIQESGGFHAWALCSEFERDGSSRRIAYNRLETWGQLRTFQSDHHVLEKHTACDYGDERNITGNYREVFGKCAEYRWYAFKSGDFEDFPHILTDMRTHRTTTILLPYSEPRLENPMSGKETKIIRLRRGSVPRGFCLSRLWSTRKIYPILYAHKNGTAKRYYGIARDIGDEFTAQLHSYIPAIDVDKKTNSARKVIWKQVRVQDHAFACAAQELVIAMVAGFFPLAEMDTKAA